ncbi:transposase [Streptomyces sp. SM1]
MKNYPPEFKADAVALYESRPEATIRSVAADLGINPETLRNWALLLRRPDRHRHTPHPTNATVRPRRHPPRSTPPHNPPTPRTTSPEE